jgi:glutaredoxin
MNNSRFQVIASSLALAGILAVAMLAPRNDAIHESNREQSTQEQPRNGGLTLYYRHGCPHCEAVEAYLNQNGIRSKVGVGLDEIYLDRSNLRELRTRAKACGLPEDAIGVPFLWDGKKCLVGDKDIIAFFKLLDGAQ